MKRIEWIDTTKAIGMILVFYGHYVESITNIEGPDGVSSLQFNFIYAFHIPLFFAVSGFFAKKVTHKLAYIKTLFLQRIIPVFAFALLFIPLWLIYNRFVKDDFLLLSILKKAALYAIGNPQLDFITWFLVCLFTTELLVAGLNLLSQNKLVNLISGLCFVIFGYFLTNTVTHLLGINLNIWYAQESIVALGFYLIGHYIYAVIGNIPKRLFYLLTPLSLVLLVLSFIYIDHTNTVIMATSTHGNLFPFILNSLLGIVFMISLGHIIPSHKVFKFIGANTLILLGLNGVFYHFINDYVAKLTVLNDSVWYITLNALIVTLISLALCYPIINLIHTYMPQLFGKPFKEGPILKPLHSYAIPYLRRKKTI
ncbi:acyltransferase family protein [uncultured Formosa sp.]|uniref:acyltransferase family protein n=1 Tax=uncultured Formosa sp. TaxID=255435 RepID=UPI00262AFBBC|nr:acyltransferase family protein [uncultured Formosa sp.]